MNALNAVDRATPWWGAAVRLWSVWDMLQSYLPIFQISQKLHRLLRTAEVHQSGTPRALESFQADDYRALLIDIERECSSLGLVQTSGMAKRGLSKPQPINHADMFSSLTHLEESLADEIGREAVFRIPADRKQYFEQESLFGSKVIVAFPSCARDIQRAGNCYALGQEDACVHHLMMVLERGLHALADKVGIQYSQPNWQQLIGKIESEIKRLPRSPDLFFYREVNAQFGFLKIAYRNHSEHAHDDPYDMEKALSILNHVRAFMQELEKGGLAE